jgi:putative flippase GtrA
MMQLFYRYKQVIKFGLVGVANTGFTYLIFYVLEKLLGVSLYIANPISYFIPTISSFYLNKMWTFKSDGEVKKEGILFFTVIGIVWLIQYGLLFLMVEKYKVDAEIAQLIGMVVFTGINFLGQKFVTFKVTSY